MKRSPLAILAVTLFLDLLGFGLIIPLIPVYITHYGGKPWVGGVLLALFSTMQFIFAPIWGRLSDRIGRRPLILMSLVGSAVSFLAFGFAPTLLVLFLARIAAGILSAASLPTAQAYIADVTPPEKRAAGMAVLGASFGLGFVCGPALGGLLGGISVFGWPAIRTPALFAAILSFINFVWAYFALPESHTDRTESQHSEVGLLDVFPAIGRALKNPQIGPQLTVFTFSTFAFAAVESSFSWLVLLRFHAMLLRNAQNAWAANHHAGEVLSAAVQQEWLEKAQTRATSIIFVIVGITAVLTQIAIMRGLARKMGENRMVVVGAAMMSATLLAIALTSQMWVLWITGATMAIGNSLLNTSLNALITESASPQERGSLSGTQQGLGSLARMVAPPINNYMVGVNTAIPFLSSFVLMTTAFVLGLRLKPISRVAPTAPEEYPVRPGHTPRSGKSESAPASSEVPHP